MVNSPQSMLIATELAKDTAKDIVPKVYDDAVSPLAKEIGKAGQTIGQTINLALSPIRGLVWSYETIMNVIKPRLEEKLKNIAPEKITTPPAYVAVPAIEALRYSLDNDELRELFTNLLATSMDLEKTMLAHPSFVEIIKQLSPLDAKLLHHYYVNDNVPICNLELQENSETSFLKLKTIGKRRVIFEYFIIFPHAYDDVSICSASVKNLERLGLINVDFMLQYTNESLYQEFESHPFTIQSRDFCNANYLCTDEHKSKEFEIARGISNISPFGDLFCRACIVIDNSAAVSMTNK